MCETIFCNVREMKGGVCVCVCAKYIILQQINSVRNILETTTNKF